MATFKHISSKNADYGAAEAYLTFEHDEFTMKPTLDENGRLIPREDYRISSLNCGDGDFAVACMVERIFQNLIINAIRYSSGSIKIDLKQGKEKSAIFIIENPIDSKVEIDPNRLFERFYTGDKSRHNSGTGVGLAVVKLLTDKLGGNVFAKIENDTLTISLEIK